MTGILKHRGISVAIALLAALALALSTMSPLVPTVRKAYANRNGDVCENDADGSVFFNSGGKGITEVTSGSSTSVRVYVEPAPCGDTPITVRVNAGLINGASEASATAVGTYTCSDAGVVTDDPGSGDYARASFTYVAPTLSGTTTSQLVQVSVDGTSTAPSTSSPL